MPFYRVELHSHCQGDPVDSYLSHSIYEQIDRAKEIGLDALAITWHRKPCIDSQAEAYARDRGLLLISGMEAEIQRRHLLVFNVAENDLPPATTWNEIRALRRRKPEVFVMAPHPFYPHPSCLGRRLHGNADCIDAVEWCILHLDWIPDRMNPNLRAARWAQQHGKPMIACSDAHSLEVIGRNASTIEAEELTSAAIFRAIRAGRVTFSRRGLALAPMVYHTSATLFSQQRHVRRWVREKLSARNGRG